MKKVSRFWLALFTSVYIFSVAAQPASEIVVMEDEYVPPLLSFGQVRSLRNQFTGWLNKHYRCLYAGRCTRQEKAEVMQQWKGWIKKLGLAAVIGLTIAYGKPKVEQASQKLSQAAQQMTPAKVVASVFDEILRKSGEDPTRPLDPDTRRERIAEFTGAITRTLIDTIVKAVDQKFLGEVHRGVPMSAEQRRERMKVITVDAVKTALGIPEDQQLDKHGVAGQLVEQVLQRLETREVQLPFARYPVKLVPTERSGQPSAQRTPTSEPTPRRSSGLESLLEEEEEGNPFF